MFGSECLDFKEGSGNLDKFQLFIPGVENLHYQPLFDN